jgi:hypothetical protein
MCARRSLLPLRMWVPQGEKAARTQKLSVRCPPKAATGGASRRDTRYRYSTLSALDTSS